MRKKLWIVLFTIVSTLALAFGISACSQIDGTTTPGGGTQQQQNQLAAPVVTVSENGVASWEEVPHALSYVYKVDDKKEVPTFNTFVQLEDGETIVVMARGIPFQYADSPYSEPVTYHKTPAVKPEPTKLDAPVVTVSEEGLATWEEVEHASGYRYRLSGGVEQTFEGETLEYQLEDGQGISVKAVGDGKFYSDSDWSKTAVYTAPVVEPTKLDTPVVTIDQTTGIASWEAVAHASAYFYKIGEDDPVRTEATSVTLEDGQTITVQAVGDGVAYSDSEWSAPKTYIAPHVTEPVQLDKPVVSVNENTGLATWVADERSEGYICEVNGTPQEKQTENTYQLHDGDELRVKAVGDGENYTDSEWSDKVTYTETHTEPTPEKLNAPEVALQGNVASWQAVAHADHYEYVITEGGQDAQPVSTQQTSVTLTDGQSIKVRAIGDGENYTDSEWSNTVTYTETHTEPTPEKLVMSEVTIDEDGRATWLAVTGAKGYICKVNGEEKSEQTDLYIQLKDGDRLQVKAVAANGNYIDSDWSEEQTYTAKQQPVEPTQLATPVISVSGTGLATWEAVDNASGYKYKVNGEAEEHILAGEALEYQLEDDQYIEVQAFSDDAEHFTASKWGKSDTYHAQPPQPATNYGTKEAPLSVAQALELAKDECPSDNTATKQMVYAKGIVVNQPAAGNYLTGVTIKDEATDAVILIKSLNYTGTSPDQNDIIVVYGYIKNYSDVLQFAQHDQQHVNVVELQRGQSTISVENDGGATVEGLTANKVTNGETVNFTVAAQEGKDIVSVTVYGKTLVAEEGSYSFEVHGDATVEIKTKDHTDTPEPDKKEKLLATFTLNINSEGEKLKDPDSSLKEDNNNGDGKPVESYQEESGEYTLDVSDNTETGSRFSVGANDAHGNVGFKLGNSDGGGTITLTIPKGVKKVVFYVAGYKSNNTTVEINDVEYEVKKHSADGEYDRIEVEVPENRVITLTSKGSEKKYWRCKINTIEFWGEEEITPATKLTMSELQVNEHTGEVTWNAVDHADHYEYVITKEGQEEKTGSVKDADRKVTLEDGETISVIAKGDGTAYSDSDPVTATYNHVHGYKADNDGWTSNATEHYKECIYCHAHVDSASHNYENGTCGTCHYEHQHSAENLEWHYEGTHYQLCSVCNAKVDEHDLEAKTVEFEEGHRVICAHSGCQYTGKKASHTYTEGEYVSDNEQGHHQVCTACGHESAKTAHSYDGKVFVNNGVNHYQECACGYKSYSPHNYDPAKGTGLCEKCSHPHDEHVYTNAKYGHDATDHWLICDVCGKAGNKVDHDELVYDKDANKHWKKCPTCGWIDESTRDDHHFHYEGEKGQCEQCGYPSEHEHNYTVHKSNETHHWLACEVCGEEQVGSRQEHTWSAWTSAGDANHTCQTTCNGEHEDGKSYTKTQPHSELVWNTVGEKHYKECPDCDYRETSEHDADYRWVYEEGEHRLKCEACGNVKEHHAPASGERAHDNDKHWYTCTGGCGLHIDEAPHGELTWNRTGEQHYQECATCGYKDTGSEHKANYQWTVDNVQNRHYQYCEQCAHEKEGSRHNAQAAGEEWKYDEQSNNHWHACTGAVGCDIHLDEAAHDSGTVYVEIVGDDANHTVKCVCGKVIKETDAHTYEYKQSADGTKHYQECTACGHKTAEAPHDKAQENGLQCTCGKWDDAAIEKMLEETLGAIEDEIGAIEFDDSKESYVYTKNDLPAHVTMTVEPTENGDSMEYTATSITFKLGKASVTVKFNIKLTFTKDADDVVTAQTQHPIEVKIPKQLATYSFTINGINVVGTAEKEATSYGEHTWSATDDSGQKNVIKGNFAGKATGTTEGNHELQFNNNSAAGAFIASNIATPTPITSVTVKVGGTQKEKHIRYWKLFTSDQPYTETQTRPDRSSVEYDQVGLNSQPLDGSYIEYTWKVTDPNAYYFALAFMFEEFNNAAYLDSIVITYKELSDEAKLEQANNVLKDLKLDTFEHKTFDQLDDIGQSFLLPSTENKSATLTWSIVGDTSEYIKLTEDNKQFEVKALPAKNDGDRTVTLKVVVNVGGQKVEGSLEITLKAYDYESYLLKEIIENKVTGMPEEVVIGQNDDFSFNIATEKKVTFAVTYTIADDPDGEVEITGPTDGRYDVSTLLKAGSTLTIKVTATYGDIEWATATKEYKFLVRNLNEQEVTNLLDKAFSNLENLSIANAEGAYSITLVQGSSYENIALPEGYNDIDLAITGGAGYVTLQGTAGKASWKITADKATGESPIELTFTLKYTGDVHESKEVSKNYTVSVTIVATMSDQEIADALLKDVKDQFEKKYGESANWKWTNDTYDLPVPNLAGFDESKFKITWSEVQDEIEVATVKGSGTAYTITILQDTVEATVTLKVEISYGDGVASDDKIIITVPVDEKLAVMEAMDALKTQLNRDLPTTQKLDEDGGKYEIPLDEIPDGIEYSVKIETQPERTEEQGFSAKFEGGKFILQVTRGDEDVTVTLTFSAKYNTTEYSEYDLVRTYTVSKLEPKWETKDITYVAQNQGYTDSSAIPSNKTTWKNTDEEITIKFGSGIKYYSPALRCYYNNTITISCIDGNAKALTKIIFTGTDGNKNQLQADSGTCTGEYDLIATWTAPADKVITSVTFTMGRKPNENSSTGGNRQITTIQVFFEGKPLTAEQKQEKLEAAKEDLTIDKTDLTSDLELPTLDGFEITWEVTEGGSNAEVVDNKTLQITRPEEGLDDVEVKLVATIKLNGETTTKEFTLTVKAKTTQGGGDVGGEVTYTLATSSTFKAGIKVVIVYDTYACGTFDSGPTTDGFMQAISGVTYSSDKNQITTLPDGAVVWTVGGVANAWTFECTYNNTAYLLIQASTKNAKMKGVTSPQSSNSDKWKITFGTGNAVTMVNNGFTSANVFQCNVNKGQERFGNYAGTQKTPYFYIVSE